MILWSCWQKTLLYPEPNGLSHFNCWIKSGSHSTSMEHTKLGLAWPNREKSHTGAGEEEKLYVAVIVFCLPICFKIKNIMPSAIREWRRAKSKPCKASAFTNSEHWPDWISWIGSVPPLYCYTFTSSRETSLMNLSPWSPLFPINSYWFPSLYQVRKL